MVLNLHNFNDLKLKVVSLFCTGIIRFWPSIAHESSSVESTVDLQGQECYSLTDLQPVGSILATTTSTVVLVSPASDAMAAGGQSVMQRKP